jgi:hypothetical protein
MAPCAQHLILITDRASAECVLAAWYRVLPEAELAHVSVHHSEWKADVLYTFSAAPDYIQALAEIIDETITDTRARLVTMI